MRLPKSNSPVTNVNSKDVVCNANPSAAPGKCAVKAGGTVTVEMHQVCLSLSPLSLPSPLSFPPLETLHSPFPHD